MGTSPKRKGELSLPCRTGLSSLLAFAPCCLLFPLPLLALFILSPVDWLLVRSPHIARHAPIHVLSYEEDLLHKVSEVTLIIALRRQICSRFDLAKEEERGEKGTAT